MITRYLDHAARYAILGGLLAALAFIPDFRVFALTNLVVQVAIFVVVAGAPAYRTGIMSYVDVAWPCGLVAIGIQTLLLGDGYPPRTLLIAAIYLLIGLRMGLPGLLYLARNRRLPSDFPRYRYQRLRWSEIGHRGETVPMQLEIFLQCAANTSILAAPAMLLAFNQAASVSAVEVGAFVLWGGAWSLEWLADHQKRRFVARGERRGTCDVGLWRYSRHPNYFFQWMGWNAVVLAALPALLARYDDGHPVLWVLSAVALVAASGFMYWTLVSFTGITPSEHYSVQKRPAYREYQRTTNRFVPGPRRSISLRD